MKLKRDKVDEYRATELGGMRDVAELGGRALLSFGTKLYKKELDNQ